MTEYEILKSFRKSQSSIVMKIPQIVIDEPIVIDNPRYNQTLDKFAIKAARYSWNRQTFDDDFWLELPENRRSEFTINHMLLINSVGGKVITGFHPFMKIAESKVDNTMPTNFPGVEYKGEYGEDLIHTWRDYRTESYPLGEAFEGYFHLPCINPNTGDYFSSESLMILYACGDVELVDSLPKTTEV